MSLVGTLLFCADCGGLLAREPQGIKTITCAACAKVNQNLWPKTIKAVSDPDAFPSALRQKRKSKIKIIDWTSFQSWPTAAQPCPSCSNPEMYFRELQMRSADEGSSIFYRCPRCDHTFKADN